MHSDKFDYIMQNLPSYWNKLDGSKLNAVVGAIAEEFDDFGGQLNTVNAAIGINGCNGTDLDNRWGALLHIDRTVGETDDHYRMRLKLSVTRLIGGTADAIKFALANVLANDNPMTDDINITDAWLYTGSATVTKEYANAVCTINLNALSNLSTTLFNNIVTVIDGVKASGVNIFYVFYSVYDEQTSFVSDMSDDVTDKIVDIILPDGFDIGGIINGDDLITDGTFHVTICSSEDTNNDRVINSELDDDIDISDPYDKVFDELITNTSSTLNTSCISSDEQVTMISIDEHGTDIIKQNGMSNVTINY